MASHLYRDLKLSSTYIDKKMNLSEEEYRKKLMYSTTLYIGNLSCYTKEEQVWELFGKCGIIKQIILGLDKFKKTPCGFCFVEYFNHEDACYAIECISGTMLDDRRIKADLDIGFEEGRQFGRGTSGGQARYDRRREFNNKNSFKTSEKENSSNNHVNDDAQIKPNPSENTKKRKHVSSGSESNDDINYKRRKIED